MQDIGVVQCLESLDNLQEHIPDIALRKVLASLGLLLNLLCEIPSVEVLHNYTASANTYHRELELSSMKASL